MKKKWFEMSAYPIKLGKTYCYDKKERYYIIYSIDDEQYFELFNNWNDVIQFLSMYDFGYYNKESEV